MDLPQVKDRIACWTTNRETQSVNLEQIKWAAAVVAYINFVWKHTRVHGNAKDGTRPTSLKTSVPFWGPRFVPPTYAALRKRDPVLAEIKPFIAYIKPLIVVHPFYDSYPDLRKCPQCGSTDKKKVKWDSWQNTGYREVRGIYHGETAIGYQLRCEDCEVQGKVHCFSTTSTEFWKKWEFWSIPSMSFVAVNFCRVTQVF